MRFIVGFCDRSRLVEGLDAINGQGWPVVSALSEAYTLIVEAPVEAAGTLRGFPGVCFVSPDHNIGVRDIARQGPPPSRVASLEQALGVMRLRSQGGEGVRVAVIGTGVVGRVGERRNWTSEAGDVMGHDTAVANIVRAVAPEAVILDGHVLERGVGPTSRVLEAVVWAAEQGADVVNVSLGSEAPASPQEPLAHVLDVLNHRMGMLAVVAGGNGGDAPGSVAAPAGAQRAFVVGSVDTRGIPAHFSGHGPDASGRVRPDLVAVGGSEAEGLAVPSVGEAAARGWVRGTSFAAPWVSGLLAQVVPFLPGAAATRQAAAASVVAGAARNPLFKDNAMGYGLLRGDFAEEALRRVRARGPLAGLPPF